MAAVTRSYLDVSGVRVPSDLFRSTVELLRIGGACVANTQFNEGWMGLSGRPQHASGIKPRWMQMRVLYKLLYFVMITFLHLFIRLLAIDSLFVENDYTWLNLFSLPSISYHSSTSVYVLSLCQCLPFFDWITKSNFAHIVKLNWSTLQLCCFHQQIELIIACKTPFHLASIYFWLNKHKSFSFSCWM